VAIIRKFLPKDKYSKMDNQVAFISKKELSDGAYRLYGALISFRTGRTINDAYILKAFDISSASLKKYKKQLKDLDLIFIDRINAKEYFLYVGSTFIGAKQVRDNWEEYEKQIKPITKRELYELREKYNK